MIIVQLLKSCFPMLTLFPARAIMKALLYYSLADLSYLVLFIRLLDFIFINKLLFSLIAAFIVTYSYRGDSINHPVRTITQANIVLLQSVPVEIFS